MNKILLRFEFAFLFWIGCITANNLQAQYPVMNWGIRLGLNALSITSYEAFQADNNLANSTYTNRNGYLINVFARFNKTRLFLQPELGWNDYRRTCSFSLPIESSNSVYPAVDLSIKSQTVNSNFVIGYNLIYDYPFLLGIFAGPSFIGTYSTDYSTGKANSFYKTGLSLNYSGILGFSINISRLYFDLRYEMCLPNANLNMKEIPGFPENYQDVRLKKTESILSFSCGLMF